MKFFHLTQNPSSRVHPTQNSSSTNTSHTSLVDQINNKLPLVLSPDEISRRQTLVNNLINTLHASHPSHLETRKSNFFSEAYESLIKDPDELSINRMTIAISEQLFNAIYPSAFNSEGMLFWPKFSTDFWQSSHNMKEKSMELYLFHRAMIFKHIHHGNCAHRSCFSAIELQKILLGSAISVTVKSDCTRDHFYIVLSLPGSTTLIYDPLTNPELLFDENTHQENILSLFKAVTNPAPPFSLTITERHLRQYEFILKKSETFLNSQKSKLSVQRIINDPFFYQMRHKEKKSVKEFNELVATALSRVNHEINTHQSMSPQACH